MSAFSWLRLLQGVAVGRVLAHGLVPAGALFLGTPVVLLAVAGVVILQLAFTYLPLAHRTFGSAPLAPEQLLFAFAAGVAVLLILELETALRAWRAGSNHGTPSPARG